jgi:uncharacterized protein (TIGR01244 family)
MSPNRPDSDISRPLVDNTALADIPYWRQVSETLYSSGQPAASDWLRLHQAGIARVINLRPAAELPDVDEATLARRAGLDYLSLPVDGAAGLTPAAIAALDAALREDPRPVLIHCGSGNRVGALLALFAARCRGVPIEAAVALGRRAGMVSLEATVRVLLQA